MTEEARSLALPGTRGRPLVAHEHVVYVYDTQDEMLRGLAHHVDGTHRARGLAVFVHSFDSDETAWEFVRRSVPGSDARSVVVVSAYTDAFQGGAPRIDYAHVQRVLDGLGQRVEREGLSGVHVFVDASRSYLDAGRAAEWFAFEEWLGRRLDAAMALVCAYQRSDVLRPDVLATVLRTHAYRFESVA